MNTTDPIITPICRDPGHMHGSVHGGLSSLPDETIAASRANEAKGSSAGAQLPLGLPARFEPGMSWVLVAMLRTEPAHNQGVATFLDLWEGSQQNCTSQMVTHDHDNGKMATIHMASHVADQE